jgi:hypothetical protein
MRRSMTGLLWIVLKSFERGGFISLECVALKRNRLDVLKSAPGATLIWLYVLRSERTHDISALDARRCQRILYPRQGGVTLGGYPNRQLIDTGWLSEGLAKKSPMTFTGMVTTGARLRRGRALPRRERFRSGPHDLIQDALGGRSWSVRGRGTHAPAVANGAPQRLRTDCR